MYLRIAGVRRMSFSNFCDDRNYGNRQSCQAQVASLA